MLINRNLIHKILKQKWRDDSISMDSDADGNGIGAFQ